VRIPAGFGGQEIKGMVSAIIICFGGCGDGESGGG
jgi:hypothetical protein